MKWFLIFIFQTWPPCGGIDCGINSTYRATNNEIKLEMPTLEVCRQVRAVNQGSKCVSEDIDK